MSLDDATKQKFEKALQDAKSKEKIELSNDVLETSNTKKIGFEDAKELADCLINNPNLKLLNLKHNKIGDEGAKVILNSLKKNNKIEVLMFGENRLTDGFIDSLCEFLKNNTSLRALDIEWNQLTAEGIKKLCETLSTNYFLTYLNLELNKIGDEGAIAISELISSNQTLRTLKLGDNGIGIEGVKAFGNCLNVSIIELSLYNKTIESDSNLIAFKARVYENENNCYNLNEKSVNWKDVVSIIDNLKVLILQKCRLTEIPNFDKFSKIVVLDLRNNNIGDEFVKILAGYLKNHLHLRQLMLQGNDGISEESAKLIYESLECNFTLCHLSLKDTGVSTGLQNEIEKRISSHRKFYRTPLNEIIFNNEKLYKEMSRINSQKEIDQFIEKKSSSELHMALFMSLVCNTKLFEQLLSNGVDVNSNYKGTPILHIAVMCDAYSFVKILFEKGVDLSTVNAEGKTCRDVAVGTCRFLFENIKQLKVVIVGKGEVGKTTLVRRIINAESQSIRSHIINKLKREERTDGIEMYEWTTGLNKDNIIQLWDFGGQELFYSTHQFFLSKNSVTLLLFKIGDPNMKKELNFWLNSIQYKTPRAKVIIVGTHFDMIPENQREVTVKKISKELESLLAIIKKQLLNRLETDRDQIQVVPCPHQKYSILFWPVSGKYGLGVNELQNLITGFSFNTVVRKNFVKLTQEILSMREKKKQESAPPVISRQELNKMISASFPSDDEMKANLKQLHELGFILDFESYHIIIHPQWLSGVFRSVISLKNSLQIKDGRIEKNQIIKNLEQGFKKEKEKFEISNLSSDKMDQYTPSIYEFLIELMEKCQICILEPSNSSNNQTKQSSRLIIPSQLPPYSSSKELEAFYDQNFNSQNHFYEIFSREYTFYFIPAGVFEDILSRILLFLGTSLKCWKDGFYFALEDQDKKETKIIFQQLETMRQTHFERYFRLSVNGEDGHTYIAAFHFLIEGVLKAKHPLLWDGVSINIQYRKKESSSSTNKTNILKLIHEKQPILDANQNSMNPVKLIPEEIPESFQIDPKIDKMNPSNIKFIPGRKFTDNNLYSSYFCRALNASGIYFIKFFKNDGKKKTKCEEESIILKALEHPNILKFLFISKNESTSYLVMESFDDSLETIQKILENGIPIELPKNPLEDAKVLNEYWWNEDEIIYFGFKILSGLNYLHEKGISYGDIRERNIGVRLDKERSKENRPKIESLFLIDFSLAQKSSEANKSSDIHSFGILLCELVANDSSYANNLNRLKLKLENHPLKNIIEECLQSESTKSPNTSQLLEKFNLLENNSNNNNSNAHSSNSNNNSQISSFL